MLSRETIENEARQPNLPFDKDGGRIFEVPSDMSEDGRKIPNMDNNGKVRVNLRFLGTRNISKIFNLN